MKLLGSRIGRYRLGGALLLGLAGCSSDRLEPRPIEIEWVALSPERASVPLGSAIQLVGRAMGQDGREIDGVQFAWSSDRPEIISVSEVGVATARSEGSATIAAMAGGFAAFATISSRPTAAGIVVSPAPVALPVGESVQLSATLVDAEGIPLAGGTIKWTSSDESVAALYPTGLVLAASPGVATISASSEGTAGTARVTVTSAPAPIAAVRIEPDSMALGVGAVSRLDALAVDASGNVLPGRQFEWSNTASSVARRTEAGLVFAEADGLATFTATSEGVSGMGKVVVTPSAAVASITIFPSNPVLRVGGQLQLTATTRDSAGNSLVRHDVEWGGGEPGKLEVSDDGLVKALGATVGVPIVASTNFAHEVVFITVVSTPATSMVISPEASTLVLGGELRLRADPRDESGNQLIDRPITWTTSNPSVVTISGESAEGPAFLGVARGVGVGTATITAISDGGSATAEVSVATVAFTTISVGAAMACGLAPSGEAFCWGDDPARGTQQRTPVSLSPRLSFSQISVGAQHACGVTTSGTAYCWGGNNFGTLGAGVKPSAECGLYDEAHNGCPAQVPVTGGLSFASVSAGGYHTCGVASDGRLYCWGYSEYGQLGATTGMPCFGRSCSPIPVPVETTLRFSAVSAGEFHACAVALDQSAYCWGRNDEGRLGVDGLPFMVDRPTPVADGHLFSSIDAGYEHTCAVAVDGAGFCWGDNVYGELGTQSQDGERRRPTPVAGGLTFERITAGGRVSCGIANGGAGYCWGVNSEGTLGTGDLLSYRVPAPVTGGLTFASMEVGNAATACGVSVAQIGFCWGRNADGRTGTGSTADFLRIPTRVAGQQ